MVQNEGSAAPAEPARKRGNPGILGKGTPGSRIKSAWRASKSTETLKQWLFNTIPTPVDAADVDRWVESKRPGGGDAAVKARRERRRANQSARAIARAAKKSSGSKKGGSGGSR